MNLPDEEFVLILVDIFSRQQGDLVNDIESGLNSSLCITHFFSIAILSPVEVFAIRRSESKSH